MSVNLNLLGVIMGRHDRADMRPKKWHILVCGRQPNQDGTMHVEHQDLVKKALAVYLSLQSEENFEEGRKVVIILLGGVSQGTKSEASLAYEYLVELAHTQSLILPEVLLEEDSLSTEENIRLAKVVSKNKGYVTSRLYLVARESQCPKVLNMAHRFWKPAEENILKADRIVTEPGLDVSLPRWYRWLDAKVGPYIWDVVVWKRTRFLRRLH